MKRYLTNMVISAVKPNVPKTKLQKKTRDLKLAIQKNKGSKAKLDQSIFEFKRNEKFTFPSKTKKSESNKEAYKRIQKDNTKVIGKMFKKVLKGDK